MGGRIGVKTTAGGGSTFWVRLPLTRARVPAVREAATPDIHRAAPTAEAACTLLYIEDNPSNLHLVERVLTACPAVRLLGARGGAEGVALARRQRPDLILLDLHLPDLPGWEVLARLRASKTTRRIPVVAVSADATPETVERAMRAGAQSYLTLPLNVDDLYRLLPERCRPADLPV